MTNPTTHTPQLLPYTGIEVRRWLALLEIYNHESGRRARLPRKIGRGLLVQTPGPFPAAWRVVCVGPDAYTIETLTDDPPPAAASRYTHGVTY